MLEIYGASLAQHGNDGRASHCDEIMFYSHAKTSIENLCRRHQRS